MKNARKRFGWLEFEKPLKDTTTRIRVALDRLIGEPPENKGFRSFNLGYGTFVKFSGRSGSLWPVVQVVQPEFSGEFKNLRRVVQRSCGCDLFKNSMPCQNPIEGLHSWIYSLLGNGGLDRIS